MYNELVNRLIVEVRNANLLNDEVKSSKEFQIFNKVLIEKYKRKNKLFNKDIELISYDEFKEIAHDLIILIMKEYLKNTKYKYDSVSCEIIKHKFPGHFSRSSNNISLSETVIKSLYDGNILALEIVFHELYHFVMKYDILSKNINSMLVKCIKDYLLSSLSFSYCLDNYTVLSYENIVDSKAIIELINFFEYNNIDLPRRDKKKINCIFQENIEYYHSNKRIVNKFSNYFKYNELFDIIINKHPEWLNYFQISVEYYINKDGFIVKRSKKQLQELLSIELEKNNNQDLINYLEELINNKTNLYR